MKKLTALITALVLMLSLILTGASSAPEDRRGQVLPDFSAATVSGMTFTLSESLKSHELVLINFWATWCGPCCMEFPFLETAWEQYSDRVDVIALSVENGDTSAVLKQFAAENGLAFPIGRDEAGMFGSMGGTAIPTTLIVDKDRRVVAVEIGSKSSAEEFAELFDSLLKDTRTSSGQNGWSCPVCGKTGNSSLYCPMCGHPSPVTSDGNPHDSDFHSPEVPEGYAKPWEKLHIIGERYELTVALWLEGNQ